MDIGLDLVAKIRPDLEILPGFGGYQFLGGNNIIVGVHNYADDPGVISQLVERDHLSSEFNLS